MKLVTLLLAGTLTIASTACGKKEDAPAPAQVSNEAKPAEATPAPKAPEATPDPKAAEATPTAKAEGQGAAVAAGDKTSCGHDMAAAAAGSEKDCPFPDEMAAKPAGIEGGCEGAALAVVPTPAPGATQHLGTAFTLPEAKPLGVVLSAATPDQQPLVRVAGTIEKVCQKKGCWMVVKDGEIEARVIMKDHAFAIPFDAKGLKATVEGTLQVKVFTEAQAKHLAEDGNEDPAKVSGEKKEFLLTATGVQLGG